MKKRLLTIVLSIVMVFTMSVPAFAGTTVGCKKPVYVVIGDSIGAGWNSYNGALGYNSSDLYNGVVRPYGRVKDAVYNGKVYDSTKIDFITDAFPTYVMKSLPNGIDEENSFNFSYPGMRAMEFCYLFGLLNSKETKALQEDNFRFLNYTDGESTHVKDDVMLEAAKTVKQSIKKASIINIELGVNDFNAAVQGDTEQLIALITSLLEKHFGLNVNSLFAADSEGSDAVPAEDVPTLKLIEKYLSVLQNADASAKDKLQALMNTLCAINKMGIDTVKTIADIDKVFVNRCNQNKKYTNRLLAYIRLLNPKAHIILLNLYNPLKGALNGIDIDLGGIDPSILENIASLVATPSVSRINNNINQMALKYNCTVADISDVVPGKISDWQCHPTADGHKKIAKSIIKALEKDCVKRGDSLGALVLATSECKSSKSVCEHANTVLYNQKDATYLEDGYTGDVCCNDCGVVVTSGEEIPKLEVAKTSIKKLTKICKGFTVKWNKKDVTGYQLQYGTSSKFNNAKKLTVKDATSKTVKSLKSGKKYYVRVRSFLTVQDENGKDVKVYSKWSAKKSVTTK